MLGASIARATLAILALTSLATLAVGGGEPPAPAGLGASVVFAPDAAHAEAYICTAEITDLGSGEVLTAPRVTIAKGSRGTARTGAQGSPGEPGWQVDLEVSVDQAGTTAAYTVTLARDGRPAQVLKSSLTLR